MSESQFNLKIAVQRLGTALSGMVMPNIGGFIAWGIITALFIPTGYLPNKNFAELVGPMLTYLLPLLIAYTGGRNIYGMGVVVSLGRLQPWVLSSEPTSLCLSGPWLWDHLLVG